MADQKSRGGQKQGQGHGGQSQAKQRTHPKGGMEANTQKMSSQENEGRKTQGKEEKEEGSSQGQEV